MSYTSGKTQTEDGEHNYYNPVEENDEDYVSNSK